MRSSCGGRFVVVVLGALLGASLPALGQVAPPTVSVATVRSTIDAWPDGPSLDADGPRPLTPAGIEAFFDAAFDVQRMDHAIVGAVVSVVLGGEVVFQRGYGWSDLERRVPVDPEETLFRIASVSKPFTWTALMQLVEEGRVALDDPVARYIDFEIPDTYSEPIRIRHLLTHTPGFEESYIGFVAKTPQEVLPLGEALATLIPARVRAPGEHASYSNYGSALAGYVVERVSGRSWEEVLETRVLQPLRMSSTNVRIEVPSQLQARHAKGYVIRDGAFVSTPYIYLNLNPAGGISSTGADMARFMIAHLNGGAGEGGRIMAPETAAQMHSPLFAPHSAIPPILHGFYRSDRNGQVVFGHGGDANQFHSNMSLLPEHDLGVFVSFNSDPGAMARSNLVPAFIDHFFPREHLGPPVDPVEDDLASYDGEYVPLRTNSSSIEKFRMMLLAGSVDVHGAESGLRIGKGGGLLPVGGGVFKSPYGGPTVVFERDADGDVSHMMVGSPLGTLERVTGLARPSVQLKLYQAMMLIMQLAVVGWVVGLFRRTAIEDRLPGHHRFVAWLQAGAFLALVAALQLQMGEIGFGMGGATKAALLAMNANLGLGLLVLAFTGEQWLKAHGTLARRVGYSLVAVAVLGQVWFMWTFNMIGFRF